MSINLQLPDVTDLKPRIIVVGVGGAGGNAVNNMISAGLDGVDFVVANTDAQALSASSAEHCIQLGAELTEGLGAGSRPEIGQAAAEEAIDDLKAQLAGAHMIFVAAGMGGGTGTGAAAVIARAAQELGILTVGVVTKPFQFEGNRRMRSAEAGIAELRRHVDTLIVIPNQNLFRIANKKTTFAEAFVLADQVLHSGISCITDLIVRDGLINLDFADVRAIMLNMGSAMMGTGEATGERRAVEAAEQAIFNPLLDDVSLKGAKGLLISVSGNKDLTLYEVDEAASRVRDEVDPDANIIVGATFDESLSDTVRVSIVASGVGMGEMRGPQFQHPGQSNPVIDQRGRDISDRLSAAIGAPPPPANVAPMAAGPGNSNPDQASKARNGGPRQPIGAQPGRAPSARPPQTGNGISDDVTIELGPPAMIRRGAAAPNTGNPPVGNRQDPAGSPTSGNANFQAAPPAPIAREPNRIPDVGEFPLVGQRDYHAKKQQHSKDSADGEKGLRPSLLRRLTGRGKNESDSLEDSNFDSGNQRSRQDDLATTSAGTGSKAQQPSATSNHRNGPQAAESSTGHDRPDSSQGIEFPMVLRDGTQRS